MLQLPSAFRCLALVLLMVFGNLSPSSSVCGQTTLLPAKPPTIGRQLQRKLIQLDNHLNNQQWTEYAALIVELLDEQSEGLVVVEGRREEKLYVDFTEYCQRQLAQAPPQALDANRRLVDSRAEAMFRQGLDSLNAQLLRQVADDMRCSTWGDEALWTLGELALSRGEFLAARTAWQKLAGFRSMPDSLESSISPADVSARLALVSIRAGHWERAAQEIQELQQQYPQSQGEWAGRTIVFAEELPVLLEQARQWQPLPADNTWPTLGGNSRRSRALPQSYRSELELAWQFPLSGGELNHPRQPIISEHLVVCQDAAGVRGLARQSGEQVFLAEGKSLRAPVSSLLLYRDQVIGASAHELWAIDTDRDGALAFRLSLDEPTERLIGEGVIDGTHLLIEIRSEDQFARSGIACFDLATPRLLWKRWVSSANVGVPIVGTSIAASPGVVYLSTNLGAIAAVRVADGRILWLRTYARSSPGQQTVSASCCVLASDKLVIAPLDSRQLLAIDPTNGQLLWTRSGIAPNGWLVGASGNSLVLNSDGLHILDVRSGDVIASNFDVIPSGQCLLVNDELFVPTQQGVERIELDSGEQQGNAIPLSLAGSVDLLGCGDSLLAVGGEEINVFKAFLETQGQTDGK